MATIVDTLFGVSPERLDRERAAAADARALAFAKLDPFQQANFAIGRGASGLAGAIGGALGGQDPELQRVTMRQQIARQINPSDPATIQQGIAALQQAGDTEGAMLLNSEFQKIKESAALIGQREAAARASEAAATRERTQPPIKEVQLAQSIALLAGPVGTPEYNQAYAEALRGQVDKSSLFTGDMANAALVLYGTADPAKILAERGQPGLEAVSAQAAKIAKGKQPVTNLFNQVTTGVLKGFGEAFQDTVSGNLKSGRSAVSTLGTIENMQALLDEGVRTGFGQESILALNKAGQLFDPEFKIKGAAGQEAFQSFATGIILPQVKQLGVNPTDADLKFISTGSPGLSKTVEGNKLLLSALDLKLKREVDLAKFTNQFLRQNKDIVQKDPLEANILYSEAFDAYTQTSPLYGPAADNLRQRFNAIGTARSTNPAARSTLERGGLVNPQ
jgi:hypothetical protein